MQLDLFDKVNWGFGIDSKFFSFEEPNLPELQSILISGISFWSKLPILLCLRTGIVPFGSSNTDEPIKNIKRHRVFLRDRKAE
ncbi:hypothetical protein LEP1GSC191_2292 [Leptospira borgpetersenii serovar Mini str. 201000851]|uniref:Uncharacterized protein n=2 Tax=Leptospira borgpetersenii TaxID=174 RepID=M3FHB1_LEPBO|nr:hypothetical protein LEP1GSC128_2471 [Leptospira borgpetersenii str. 200801926]EMG01223.1 hypothetical protein LEP1GSC123_0690 [Leptospira borgpetersenii str. 200701203]EMK11025.1 hypothetical protein LEP1GSC066_2323 [Leptospira sp. serovar Kenya str. Sh9]ENO65065.1 hypothetical protein LEP1GSC191_2292 [Leptospira borgpetersenii serovar Mini str. 201000851]